MKERLKKALATIGAAVIALTASGCSEEEIRKEYNQEKEKIMNELDEKLENQKNDIKEYIDSINKTTSYEQILTTTETTITTDSALTELKTEAETTVYTTQQTEQTETIKQEVKQPKLKDISIDVIGQDANMFEVTTGANNLKIDDEDRTMFKIAYKYHPSNMTTSEFLKQIQELNGKTDASLNDTIKVPCKLLYINPQYVNYMRWNMEVDYKEICRLNNMTMSEFVEKADNGTIGRLLIAILPTDATKACNDTLYIAGNKVMVNDENQYKIIPIEEGKTYIKINKNDIGTNRVYITEYDERYNELVDYYYADNIKDAYVLSNGIPVFITRTEEDCEKFAEIGKYIKEYYETVVHVKDINKFYKDPKGNECFTYNQKDLSIYGYTKAPEIAESYYRGDWYYAQDETGIDWAEADSETVKKLKEDRQQKVYTLK